MTTHPAPHRVLDVLGYFCPIPVIRTSRAVGEMAPGQVLEILSDDRGVLADIPDWCAAHGHHYLGHRAEGRAYRLLVRKG